MFSFSLSGRSFLALLVALLLLRGPSSLHGQAGDRPHDDPQKASELSLNLPVARVLTPAEEAETFHLPPGFEVELVAAEPLVRDPVAMVFDPEGNLWVAEMSGYNAPILKEMPSLTVPGTETWATGKIVKLEDTDGDGRMDKRTVFLDNLDSPRALAIVKAGVLVADPANVWLVRDTNGDGVGDERELVADDYGPKGNGEGAANGLLWGRDNVLHNVSYGFDFKQSVAGWERIPIATRGQFGLTQDDWGRLYFNRNSDQFRTDLFSPHYARRNPDASPPPWVNWQAAQNQIVWPGHATPGVNRGYRKDFLRPDASLVEFTAACSPLIYRGANFPVGFYGNGFVTEPAANMVRRNLLLEAEGRVLAVNAYDGREFMFSTDERFRPVALANTPAGDLYVADMYRGVLQEIRLITTYLTDQTRRRELQKPMFGLGRIWRVRYTGGPVENRKPDLRQTATADLVRLLTDANAWWRDTAQQVLVERGDKAALPALIDLAMHAPLPRTRGYALWTLDGLRATTPALLAGALRDPEPKIRAAAVRLSESGLRSADADNVVAQLAPLARDPSPEVLVQLALSLGEAQTPAALRAMIGLLNSAGGEMFVPESLVSGLAGRESDFFSQWVEQLDSAGARPEYKSMLSLLAEAMARQGTPGPVDQLLVRIGDGGGLPVWIRLAVLDGLGSLTKASVRRSVPEERRLTSASMRSLAASTDPSVRAEAGRLAAAFSKLEKAQVAAAKAAVKLTPDEVRIYEKGKTVFQLCAACHQPSGTGLPGLAPSLVDSPWVVGRPELPARILLNGKQGTSGFPAAMPPLASLSDDDIAAVLTYVRNSWGLHAGAVSPRTVTAARLATAGRVEAWTDQELQKAAAELKDPSS